MRLSVVIPVLNGGASLADCLAPLGDGAEIIVVDGGSTDDSVAIAEQAGARVIAAPRGRGLQLHSGAKAARGDWLLFLHADTVLQADWRAAITAHAAAAPERAAYFALRLDDDAWQARMIESGVALRVRLIGLPYGDQGLFISRALYDEVGGFRPLALMEDVDLVRRLGANRLSRLDAAAMTSADRWRRDGWLRRSARNLACLTLYAAGMGPERLARFYR